VVTELIKYMLLVHEVARLSVQSIIEWSSTSTDHLGGNVWERRSRKHPCMLTAFPKMPVVQVGTPAPVSQRSHKFYEIKITVAIRIRCQVLRLKHIKFDFGWGSQLPKDGGKGRGRGKGREGKEERSGK